MPTFEENQTSKYVDVGDRPYVSKYVNKPKLNVGDRVYLLDRDRLRKGPYLVSSLPSTGKCTLSLENGNVVNNGAEVDLDDLETV